MLRNYIYWGLSSGALGLMLFAAPTGAYLTFKPSRGKVVRDTSGRATVPTVRTRGSSVYIFGGGYQGGK